MKDKIFTGLLIATGALDLWQIYSGGDRWISKPLIMLVLIGYYLFNMRSLDSTKPRFIFLIALFAALAGDSFLLFEGCFVYGLGSFLLMQILYSYCFWKDRGVIGRKRFYLILLFILIVGVTYMLWDSLGEMKIPVMIYMVAISVMSLLAYFRDSVFRGFWWIFLGTVFFVVSDTVLAIHQFTDNIQLGSLTVMMTYITAQYFIVHGYIKDHRVSN